tara:strand:+ start:626 stop:754 length:129 start_codon:yes stop_codon:yes gene_type:complete
MNKEKNKIKIIDIKFLLEYLIDRKVNKKNKENKIKFLKKKIK